ncbi:hypothetical protein AVEN_43008-1 [Araneus ventricosus]|uniref:Uncharacterized protein n=1 Tax=Araneus ventricosus TaxID=182803 RepID=A0A4Y2J6M1_ARAVE|nr:hypothetical protein AVEN_43008-1 [Araneus ventricosus]
MSNVSEEKRKCCVLLVQQPPAAAASLTGCFKTTPTNVLKMFSFPCQGQTRHHQASPPTHPSQIKWRSRLVRRKCGKGYHYSQVGFQGIFQLPSSHSKRYISPALSIVPDLVSSLSKFLSTRFLETSLY